MILDSDLVNGAAINTHGRNSIIFCSKEGMTHGLRLLRIVG